VRALAFSPDSSRLASASYDKSVKVWDLKDGKELFTLRGHTEPVNGLAFSADGRRLATAGWDSSVRVWNAAAGQEAQTLTGHKQLVRSVAFSPDGRLLASAGADQTIRLWYPAGPQSPSSWRDTRHWYAAWPSVRTAGGSPRPVMMAR
jgi:WD40 repeat protein